MVIPGDLINSLFHDVLTLGPVAPGLTVTLTNNIDDNMLDASGNPLADDGSVTMTEDPMNPGNYSLVFYHKPDVRADFVISIESFDFELSSSVCAFDRSCLVLLGIPTMGQWALLILGLLMSCLGLVYMFNMKRVAE